MTVFFDIDDTLYDRSGPFKAAASEFFVGAVKDLHAAYRICVGRGDEVFLASQRGEITMDEMYIYRWGKGFADIGVDISPEEALSFQRLYRSWQDRITLSPVIEDMLVQCRERARLGIITNGPSEKQWNKISRLGLERFIERDMIIVSGDVGVDKPDSEIFRIAEKRSGAKPADLLYVGDSLPGDILSAQSCGWHTVWYNREAQPLPADVHPDAVVTDEAELLAALNKLL